jgi:hypothetical protein
MNLVSSGVWFEALSDDHVCGTIGGLCGLKDLEEVGCVCVCVCLWENDLRYDDPLRRF